MTGCAQTKLPSEQACRAGQRKSVEHANYAGEEDKGEGRGGELGGSARVYESARGSVDTCASLMGVVAEEYVMIG